MGLQLYLHDRCRPVRDYALIIENLRKKNAVSLRADHSPVWDGIFCGGIFEKNDFFKKNVRLIMRFFLEDRPFI